MAKKEQKNDKKTKTKVPPKKQKKAKPAKVPKAKKKGALPKDKKAMTLLIVALFLIIIGAATAIILLVIAPRSPVKKEVNVPQPPSYYFSKKDDISSITEVVGKRDFLSVTNSIPSANGKENSTQSDTESNSQESTSVQEAYKYANIEDVSADLSSYADYLEGKSFINVTDNTQKASDSSDKDSAEEKSEFYQYAGPANDLNSYLKITLEGNADSYTVIASEGDEPWNTYFKELWNTQKEQIEQFQKQPKVTNTIAQAENTVRSQGQKKLGLPEEADTYEYIAAPGLSQIDGNEYYTVRTYKRQPDKTLIYVATYLYDYKTSQVSYAFDEVSRKYTPLG